MPRTEKIQWLIDKDFYEEDELINLTDAKLDDIYESRRDDESQRIFEWMYCTNL